MADTGCVYDPRNVAYLVNKRLPLGCHLTLYGELNKMIFLVSQVGALNEQDLLIYHQYRHDQKYRDKELKNHQSLARPKFADRSLHHPLQYGGWTKPRQIQCWIASCN